MLKKKKGFTLVELLIVIVVIGVLSAMMMLSSTEAVSSAKAAKIISNLRNWKTATLEWYTDNIDRVNSQGKIKHADNLATGDSYNGDFGTNIKPSEITKYLGGEFGDDKEGTGGRMGKYYTTDSSGFDYSPDHVDNGKIWLIACRFPDDTRLKEKLEARASSAGGLFYKESGKLIPYTAAGSNRHMIWIEVIDFSK